MKLNHNKISCIKLVHLLYCYHEYLTFTELFHDSEKPSGTLLWI